jgi:putative tricarboxylic transport membrane protein
MSTGAALRRGEAAFAGVLLALAAFLAEETFRMTVTVKTTVGPKLFPYLIAAGLAATGLSMLREARSGHGPHAAAGLEMDRQALGLVAAGLAVQFLTVEWLGWMPAAAVLFVMVARAFGERRMVWNLLIGAALAAATYFAFTAGLGLNLPVGSLFEANVEG